MGQPLSGQPSLGQPSSGQPSADGGVPFVPNPIYEDPTIQAQFILTATVPQPWKKCSKEAKVKRHIKMMVGRKQWSAVDALREMPAPGLNFGNLCDLSRIIRVAISKSLQLDRIEDKRPKAKARGHGPVEANAVVLGMRPRLAKVMNGVLPEPNIRFLNFHTVGNVLTGGLKHRVDKVLIDGGAVVNLMPEKVARQLNLPLVENSDILIRTATNEIRAVQYCTRFNIDIAGVIAEITVHVLDIPHSYSLLLGRRWLYQVRAQGDYAKHSYTIYDSGGQPHNVPPSDCGGLVLQHPGPEVLVNPNPDGESQLSEQEREEIMIGRERMQEIVADVVTDAKDQLQEQMALWDEESSGSDDNSEFEDDFYVYPGSDDESPKGGQQ